MFIAVHFMACGNNICHQRGELGIKTLLHQLSEDTSDLVTVGSSNTVRLGVIREFPRYIRVSKNGSWIIVPVLSSPSCLGTHPQCYFFP